MKSDTITEEEIFKAILSHLRAQGKPSLTKDNSCAYRTSEGLSCAVGCLLTDEEYSPKMEGVVVEALKEFRQLPQRLIEHVEFLTMMQRVHDKAMVKSIELFEAKMSNIAAKYRFEYSEIEHGK